MSLLINEQIVELCHYNDLLQVQFINSIEGNFILFVCFIWILTTGVSFGPWLFNAFQSFKSHWCTSAPGEQQVWGKYTTSWLWLQFNVKLDCYVPILSGLHPLMEVKLDFFDWLCDQYVFIWCCFKIVAHLVNSDKPQEHLYSQCHYV